MQKSSAWKLALLDEALPKFTSAIQACENTEDTSEIQEPARDLIKLIQDLVFPGETSYLHSDP